MSRFIRILIAGGLGALSAGCSSLDGTSPLALPAFPSLPAFSAGDPAASAGVRAAVDPAGVTASPPPAIRAASNEPRELTPPEANILASSGPVKAAVLPALIGLGYKVATDTPYSTVLTKLSGSRLSTIRLTVTFASIGTQTRVIADLRRTASGSSEIEPALDHPDRDAIQARLNQVKAQLDARPAPPPAPLASSGATGAPSPLTPTQPASAPPPAAPPALQPVTAAPPVAPAPSNPPPSEQSWFPQIPFPRLGGEPSSAVVQQATPNIEAQRPARRSDNPFRDLIPNLPPVTLPNLLPAAPSDAPPDDRPLRKGQTRVRL